MKRAVLMGSAPGGSEPIRMSPLTPPFWRDARAPGAYARALQHFAWDAKARKMLEVDEWVNGAAQLEAGLQRNEHAAQVGAERGRRGL